MATSSTKIGRVSINPQGEYQSGTQYQRLDVVTSNGSSYICVQDCQGIPVSNTSYWFLLASKGDAYEVTEEDLQRIATQIEQDASSSFNQNVTQKTNEFNANAVSKTEAFDGNASSKTTDFNDNASSKTTAFNNNATSKTGDFNTNATNKTTSFDANYDDKMTLFNGNATTKTGDFNDNATAKTTTFNNNATDKTTAFDGNATDKTTAFDTNYTNKVASFDSNAATYEKHIEALEDNFDPDTSPNSNDFTLTNSASGFTKNIKIGDEPELKQITTTGTQLLNIPDGTYTKDGKSVVFKDGIGTPNFTTISSTFTLEINLSESMTLSANTTYTLSSNTGATYPYINLRTGNTIVVATASGQLGTYTFSLENDATIDSVQLYFGSTTATYGIIKPQLNLGSTATEFEPYTGGQPSPSPDYPQDIVVVEGSSSVNETSKNIYNYADTNAVTDGINVDKDGWITVSYDNTNGSETKYFNYYTNNLNLKTNTEYAIVTEIKSVSGTGEISASSASGSTGQFLNVLTYSFSNLSSSSVKVDIRKTKTTFSGVTKGIRTFIAFNAGQSGSITFRLSVLADTTVTPSTFSYVPFKGSNTFPLTLPAGMFLGAIGTASNYIYGTRDNWKLHIGLGKIVLNGTENWTDNGGGAPYSLVINNSLLFTSGDELPILYCNYFHRVEYSANWSNINNFISTGGANRPNMAKIKYPAVNDLTEFKAWLAQKAITNIPVVLYYAYRNSTETAITDSTLVTQLNTIADNLETYKGGTIVFTTSDNLEPNIQFDYMVNPFASIEARLDLLEA